MISFNLNRALFILDFTVPTEQFKICDMSSYENPEYHVKQAQFYDPMTIVSYIPLQMLCFLFGHKSAQAHRTHREYLQVLLLKNYHNLSDLIYCTTCFFSLKNHNKYWLLYDKPMYKSCCHLESFLMHDIFL